MKNKFIQLSFVIVAILFICSSCQQSKSTDSEKTTAVGGDIDRSALHIKKLTRQLYKVLDAHNAKAPDRFEVTASKGGPNVVVVLIDDIGFGVSQAFGESINMPTLDRVAATGLEYNRFHTTALLFDLFKFFL